MTRWREGQRVPADIDGRGLDPGGRRGPGGVLIPGGGPGGPAGVMYTVGAPWTARPPGATDFQIDGTIAAATNANTPAAFPGGFTIPSGNVGVIRTITVLANNLLTSSDIRFRLRFNQAPVSGWNTLTILPRAAGSVAVTWTPDETYVHVPEGATVDFVGVVLDGGTYQLSVQAHGWYYGQERYRRAVTAYQGA